MKHSPYYLVEAGLSVALLSGAAACSSGGGEEAPSLSSPVPTSSSPTPLGPTLAPSSETPSPVSSPTAIPNNSHMAVEYFPTTDASDQLLVIQQSLGNAAINTILDQPFTISVNGQERHVRVQTPRDPAARKQIILVTADSKNAGELLTSVGITGHENDKGSETLYQVSRLPDGSIAEAGQSVSVIGQETDTDPGLIHEATTEYCQGLELVSTDANKVKVVELYQALKETVCNAAGVAADSKFLGQSYPEYVQRMKAAIKVGPDVNHGYNINYPILPAKMYAQLKAR